LVIERSAEVFTVVPAVAELFPGVPSEVLEDTVAVLEMFDVRPAFTFTVRWTVVEAPFAMLLRFQVTVPAVFVPPPSALTKLVPFGSGSESETLCAVEGPLFVTTIV
jgi:hypothetical protein